LHIGRKIRDTTKTADLSAVPAIWQVAEKEETAIPYSRGTGAFGGMQRRGLKIPAFRSMNRFPVVESS